MKKLLSLLALALCTASSTWADPTGDGSSTSPYQITNATDLVWFAEKVNTGTYNACAILMNDIDMTDADISKFPIGTGAKDGGTRYTGTFDGQGHKISNFLLINTSAADNYGMFNTGANVVLKNFWLDSSCKIQGKQLVGLIGRHDGAATFEGIGNCADVTGTNNNLGGLIGGVWGQNNGSGSSQTVSIINCWTTGKVTSTNTSVNNHKDCGALTGWFNNAKVVITNFWTVAEVVHTNSNATYVFRNGSGASFTYSNCFSMYGEQPNFINFTTEQLANGWLCYGLNGDQTDIAWYQTLGTDNTPTLDNSHSIVYRNGRSHCDGTAYEGVTGYSNSPSTQDAHEYVDGFCSYCDLFKPDAFVPVNGYYEIANGTQLRWFATKVNTGGDNLSANAKLTADIDLTGVTWTPIGNNSKKYTGTFDGQGHAITNFSYTATGDYNGLFGFITGTAEVKNFSISGTLTSNGHTKNGVIGSATGTAKVIGIHSALTINVSNYKAHSGGIVGGDDGATTTKIVVEGCEYSGTMTHSGTGDNQAGIMGYTGYSTIRNCIFSGTINGATSRYAGILGYCKQSSFGGVQNCLSIGKIVVSSDSDNKAAIIGTWNGGATSNVKNNYYCLKEGSNITRAIGGNTANCEAPVLATTEQLASGEICYLLNGDQSNIAFYQTLEGAETDARPVLDNTHLRVYKVSGTPAYVNTLTGQTLQISTAAELDEYAALVNEGATSLSAELTDDITASETFEPIGTSSNLFAGTIEGNGHSITLAINEDSYDHQALVGYATGGTTIQNLIVKGSVVSTNGKTAGFIAETMGSGTVTITNCGNEATINGGGAEVGGIIGNNYNGQCVLILTNVYNAADVTGGSRVAGICGDPSNMQANSVFTNVYNSGHITGPTYGDFVGVIPGCTFTNCYSTELTEEETGNGILDIAPEEVTSGELCYKLNGDQSAIVFYQDLSDANHPSFSFSSDKVVEAGQWFNDTNNDVFYNLEGGNYQLYLLKVSDQIAKYDVPTNVNAKVVNITRTIPAGQWIGLCLPYSCDIPEGWTVRELTGVIGSGNDAKMSFTAAESIVAGKPYIVNPTEAVTVIEAADKDIATASALSPVVEGDVTMIGNFAPETLTAGTYYINTSSQLKKLGAGYTANLKGFRAYFTVTEGSGIKALNFDFDDATGINDLDVDLNLNDGAIYNIAGQRLNKVQKGINIINGKKILY